MDELAALDWEKAVAVVFGGVVTGESTMLQSACKWQYFMCQSLFTLRRCECSDDQQQSALEPEVSLASHSASVE